jgi:AraC family transcriptional regulator
VNTRARPTGQCQGITPIPARVRPSPHKGALLAHRQAVYIVPPECDGRWRLNGPSACNYLALPWQSVLPLLAEFEVAQPREWATYLSAKGFAEPTTHTLINRLWLEASRNGCSELLVSSYRLLIIHNLVLSQRIKVPAGLRSGRLRPEMMRRASEYIDANLAADVSVENIAAAVGLSPFHFSKLFKATTGLSPYRYILNSRLERAKELLTSTKYSAGEIAQQVGFSSHSSFSRAFQRAFGYSPKQYRTTRTGN